MCGGGEGQGAEGWEERERGAEWGGPGGAVGEEGMGGGGGPGQVLSAVDGALLMTRPSGAPAQLSPLLWEVSVAATLRLVDPRSCPRGPWARPSWRPPRG